MSDADIEALLRSEGVEPEGADALVEWARGRAAELIASTEDDPELGPLLREGGQAGAEERSHGRRRARGEDDEAPRRGRKRKEERKRRGRARGEEVADAEREPEKPSAEPEREEPLPDREPEWRATLHGGDPVESPPPTHEEEVTTPRGESSSAGPLPPVPSAARSSEPDEAASDEVEEIEEIDAEELEMIDEEVAAEPEPARDTPTFGPPDGTDAVPAWKAALLAAETGSDREAAELMKKEESGVKPLPQTNAEPMVGERLEAEEDEISQHKIDLSDLDGSPET
jgi:hypothetical protein